MTARKTLPQAKVDNIGHAAARLHRLLKELGHAEGLQQSAATMPDARDRLSFIDQTMHEASEKTISAVENSLLRHNLLQIMEAQEFRDVAGQMVNKILDAAVEIEKILLDILREHAPDSQTGSLIRTDGLTAGPAMKPQSDGLNGQDEVDDLLASMGF